MFLGLVTSVTEFTNLFLCTYVLVMAIKKDMGTIPCLFAFI